MIVYDLICDSSHRFEGWFGSSSDFDSQRSRGLLACPQCGSEAVDKAPMAPAVPVKGNREKTGAEMQERAAETAAPASDSGKSVPPNESVELSSKPMPPAVEKAFKALAKAQSEALEKSTWVGEKFAEKSRAIHYGEADDEPIHGRASPEEAQALVDEGIDIAPLIVPFVPPEERN